MSIVHHFEMIVEQMAKLIGLEVDYRSHVDDIELCFRDPIYKHCQSKGFVHRAEIYHAVRIEDLARDVVRMAASEIKEQIKKEKESEKRRVYITTARGNGKTWLTEAMMRKMNEFEETMKRTFERSSDMFISKNHIKDVIFNPPATIVMWKDGTKTVVKAQNDEAFDPEKGLAMAIAKKALGNQGNYFETIKKYTETYKPEKREVDGEWAT